MMAVKKGRHLKKYTCTAPVMQDEALPGTRRFQVFTNLFRRPGFCKPGGGIAVRLFPDDIFNLADIALHVAR